MKKSLLFALILSLTVSACSTGLSNPSSELKSSQPRQLTPQAPSADVEKLTADNSAFAFDLYHRLSGQSGNLFFSPYSISAAMAMTYAGARTDTADQMATGMHFSLPQTRFHPAFNDLDLAIKTLADSKTERGFQLNIANALWGQKDLSFQSDFLDLLSRNYGAGLNLADFKTNPEATRQSINQWVSRQTNSKIQDLVAPGAINNLTRLVLVNAIYFKAQWAHTFEPSLTTQQSFHLLDGRTINASLMKQSSILPYFQGQGFAAVELPYQGNQVAMLILVPDAGQFDAFEQALTQQQVEDTVSHLEGTEVTLAIPKFQFASTFNLSDTLKAMGMPAAFDPSQADFSGMDGQKDLYISDVLHKAFINVDENGTEAAAATVVIVGTTAMPAKMAELTIDRPFIFLIRDTQNGTILFIGRVLDPTKN
jgi:serpin B